MADEGPEEEDARGDWVYSLLTSRFGHQSYEYIRPLGHIQGENMRFRQHVGYALTRLGVYDPL
jgi:hypothetical protein